MKDNIIFSDIIILNLLNLLSMNYSNQSQTDKTIFQQAEHLLVAGLKRMRTPHFMITFATIFLLIYVLFINLEANAGLIIGMFTFSQFMVVGLAYVVIRHGVFDGKKLKKDDEFGYEDYDHENRRFTRSVSDVMEQLKESKD